MLHSVPGQGYYDMDNNNIDMHQEQSDDVNEMANTTPFSVRDILNMVDQNEDTGYSPHLNQTDYSGKSFNVNNGLNSTYHYKK